MATTTRSSSLASSQEEPSAKRSRRRSANDDENLGSIKQSTALHFSDIPDAVFVETLLPFLGPKDVLPTIGTASKKYRELANADIVWQQFCYWRGSEKSRMWNKMKKEERDSNGNVSTTFAPDKIALLRRFEAFHHASKCPNALDAYKRLHISSWPKQDYPCNGRIQDYPCNGRILMVSCETPIPVQFECQWPGCTNASCEEHGSPQYGPYALLNGRTLSNCRRYRTCSWCRLQVCSECDIVDDVANGNNNLESYERDFEFSVEACNVCHKGACADCRNIVGIQKTRKCPLITCSGPVSKNTYCCEGCAWKVEGNAGSCRAKPVDSVDELCQLNLDCRMFCSRRCANMVEAMTNHSHLDNRTTDTLRVLLVGREIQWGAATVETDHAHDSD
jgi:hypothetical protein